MCSTERKPSRVASLISLSVTSFSKSTNDLSVKASRGGSTPLNALSPPLGRGLDPALTTTKPAALAASSPAANPSLITALSSKIPRQPPAERSRATEAPGTKASSRSSKRSVPPDCENRCTDGVRPRDISTKSQRSRLIVERPSRELTIFTELTRRRPEVALMAEFVMISSPAARAAAESCPSAFARGSMIAMILMPAVAKSRAAR